MIIGQHFVKVGEKNRIAFPKKMRDEMGNDLIVSYGFDKAIMVFAKRNWEEVIAEIDNQPFLRRDSREVKRFLIGGATQVECDNQGRFVLPEYLKEFAGVKNEIVALGMGKYVEIWDKERWEAHRKEAGKDIEETAQNLVDKI